MRTLVFAALSAAALVLPAQAAETLAAPSAQDGNVIEFRVLSVLVPDKLPSHCVVTAQVGKVWQGAAYRTGQPLALQVPCAEYGLIPVNVRTDGIMPVNARSLAQSQRGIARLDDHGELVWSHEGARAYGPWGAVAGYRVLDVRMLPAPIRS